MLGDREKCGSCAQLLAHLGRLSQSSKKFCRQGLSSKCVTTRRWDAKPCLPRVGCAWPQPGSGCNKEVL